MSWDAWDSFEQGLIEWYFKAWCTLGAIVAVPILIPFAVIYLVRQMLPKLKRIIR